MTSPFGGLLSQYAHLYKASGGIIPAVPPSLMKFAHDSAGFNPQGNFAFDAAVGGGMVFLESELEKRDPKVREPLIGLTFPRDITIESGGGWVDYTSTFNVNYGTSGPNQGSFQGSSANQIPVISADVGKDIYAVTNWGHVMKVTFIDMQKSSQVGRSLDAMYDTGIRTNWNISLNTAVYKGWGSNAGLLNNSSVTASSLPNGASGSSKWINKTPSEILYDVNTMLYNPWLASNYDLSGMPNSLLIPPFDFGYIATTPISVASGTTGGVSILKYLLENNLAVTQERPFNIFPTPFCVGTGTGGTDRAVAYVNNKDRVYFDVPVPVQRIMTQPTVSEGGAYLTLFLGQYGVVKILAFEPIAYFDGI